MLTRRELLGTVAALGCGLTSTHLFAKNAPIQGKDYTIVRPALEYPRRPILIHDFFAYTCPHCLQFEPVMSRFIEKMKSVADVRIVPVPVAWNESYGMFPRAYYSFAALGRLNDLHLNFWDWVIRDEHNWESTEAVEKDILNWVTKNGIQADVWTRTMTSFAVVAKARSAAQTWKSYGVDSTPCVGIAGQFITAPHLTGTRQGTIEVIEYLLEQVRQA